MRKALTIIAFIASADAMAQSDRLVVSHLEVVPGTVAPIVTGVAENRSSKTIKNAFIKFNLYDRSGALVGNTITHVADLDGLGKWKFRAPASINFATAKVVEVTAFDH